MLYNDFLYGNSLYGTDILGNALGGPISLNAYQNQEDSIIFYWTYSPYGQFLTNSQIVWEIQIDTTEDFNSENLTTYLSNEKVILFDDQLYPDNAFKITINGTNYDISYDVNSNQTLEAIGTKLKENDAIEDYYVVDADEETEEETDNRKLVLILKDYSEPFNVSNILVGGETKPTVKMIKNDMIPGCIYRGCAIDLNDLSSAYDRLQGEKKRIYWRVRAKYFNFIGAWKDSNYDLMEDIDEVIQNSLLSFLPDIIYKKTEDGNLYKLFNGFAKELNEYNIKAQFVERNISVNTVTDNILYNNFGTLTGVEREDGLSALDYREIVKAFFKNIRKAPSMQAISNMLYAIYRNYPGYVNIRDQQDVYVVDDEENTPYYVEETLSELNSIYLLDNIHYDFGVFIDIENNFSEDCKAIITEDYVTGIIRKMTQAHTPVYFRFI